MKARLNRLRKNTYDLKLYEIFEGELDIIKTDYRKNRCQLSNGHWYNKGFLDIKKESGGKRIKKSDIVKINVDNVNELLKVGEYEVIIDTLNKECNSWMNDCNKLKEEKLLLQKEKEELEVKYNSKKERLLEVLKTNLNLEDLNKKILEEQLTQDTEIKKLKKRKYFNTFLLSFGIGYFIYDIILFFTQGI